MRRPIVAAITRILAVMVGDARAQSGAEFSAAVNLAGRQRMLSQKMSKELALIALGVDAANQRTQLGETIELFESSLTKLRDGDAAAGIPAPPNQAIADQLRKVGQLWLGFKDLLESGKQMQAVDRAVLEQVAAQNLPLLKEANAAVQLYVVAAGKAGIAVTSNVVDIAGRQRMLSQKMSKEILFIALDIDAEAQRSALAATRALFARCLDGLIAGDEELKLPATTDEAILQQLRVVSGVWQELSPLVDTALSGKLDAAYLENLASLNLRLLSEMNRAVLMFAGLSES